MTRTVLVPPHEHCWIESDLFDRSLFAELLRDTPSLAALVETGGTLVPHFRDLLEDVFCLLYKLDPAWRDAAEVGPSAALSRVLLEALRDHPLLDHLRSETQLDEAQAGLATVLLGEELLAMIRAERLMPRGDMLDLWDLEQKEELVRSAAEQQKALEAEGASEDAQKRAARTAELAEAQLRQKSRQVAERLREMPARARQVLPAAASGMKRRLEESRDDAQGWGDGLGAGGGTGGTGRQIELGRRLVNNPKLKRLAALVGRMRPQAMALRRRTLERSSEEVHDVELAGTIERLLPSELVSLRHPLLRRDFARRLVEGQLLAYRLHGTDRHGRGPMIVCLDGSSSMAGEKEIWSKAVALTLLEIARRQRRLFRFLCFASKETPLYILDLNPRAHHTVQADRAFDLAEYFPGGGTDFETPLDAAVDTLGGARYRRGDVVLITDGECRVSPEWLARFKADKKRLDFSLYSVLIDVGTSSTHTLTDFSDRVTSVSDLTDTAVRDLFRQL